MGAYESAAKLSKAMRDLMFQWNETKASWNDPNSRRFEENCILPLQAEIRKAGTSMSEMAALLDQLRRECS